MSHEPYWLATSQLPRFPKVEQNLKVDVVIVGGGFTGISTAYLLKKTGRSVALLERDSCCSADTGHTTAHLTYVTDLRLNTLVKNFGRDHAQAVWDAARAALETIQRIVQEERIDCGLSWAPGYLHVPCLHEGELDVSDLQEDAELANELGFDAVFMDSVPVVNEPGVRFTNQAKFHPLRYLAGLLRLIPGSGCHVFENSEVTDFQAEPLGVRVNGHLIDCKYIVVATHVPMMGNTGFIGATLLQTKLASYSSYVLGAHLDEHVPDILLWDTAEPYHYLRIDRTSGDDYVIFGGEDHKTGQESDGEERFGRLEKLLKTILPGAKVNHRWSGQVVETNDGLPYIGETADRQFVATGFCGNGMTFGTLGAMMAADAALGRKNPWSELFAADRKMLKGGTWDYLKENIDYPYYMLRDRMAAAEGDTLESVRPGQGKILKIDGQRLAVYRSDDGELSELSPSCTHMGCLVRWNDAEKTWDCPCHGSRFKATGEVLAGPAETPLEPQTVANPH